MHSINNSLLFNHFPMKPVTCIFTCVCFSSNVFHSIFSLKEGWGGGRDYLIYGWSNKKGRGATKDENMIRKWVCWVSIPLSLFLTARKVWHILFKMLQHWACYITKSLSQFQCYFLSSQKCEMVNQFLLGILVIKDF